MNNLPNIVYNFGKFWITLVLFVAMIISAIVSLPFILAGKIVDMWRQYQLHQLQSEGNSASDYYR